MATVSERLQFLISANADQAIRAFEKTANSAEKEMSKSTKNIDKLGRSMTQFGARGLAAAGVMAAGLFKMSQGAIDDQKAQALLATQLRQTAKATDEQIATVEKYIDTTARAVGVADDELRPAFAQLVRATGSMTKAQKLLNLSLDVSAGTGKDLKTVTMALSKASAGQVGALTRLGIPLDENIKKSKDFAAATEVLNQQFGGQAAVAADTYAGRLARAKVALEETKEEIGAGFIPVVQASAGAVATAAGGFTKLNDATGGSAAKLASYGTVAIGVVSAVSLVAGQMIKMRTAFKDADGNVTKMGTSMKAAGYAMATLAITDVVFNALNNASGTFNRMDTSLNDLLATFAKVNGETSSPVGAATRAFRDMVRAEADAVQFKHLWTDWGKKVAIAGGTAKRPIEDVDTAFKKLLEKGGTTAGQALIDDMRNLAAGLDKNSDRYKDTMMLVERYEKRINNLTAAEKGLVAIQDEKNKVQEEAAAKLKAQEEAQRKATEAAEKYKNKLKELRKAIGDDFVKSAKNGTDALTAATKAFDDYRNTVADAVRSTYGLGGALEEGETFMSRLRKSAADALKFGENIQKLLAMDIDKGTLDMLIASGAETGAAFAEELLKGGQAAVDEADRLTASVTEAAKRAGTDAAGEYYQQGINVATALTNGINDVISKYKISLKSKGLTDKQLAKLKKNFGTSIDFEFTSRGFDVPEMANGGIVPATNGGQLIRVAEAGQAEAIVPLPNGMRNLGGGDTYITIQVTSADPNAVVDALRRYQRQNGAIPVRTM